MSTVGGYLKEHSGDIKDTKVVSAMATGIRLAQYPDGTQKIQGAYAWVQGFKTGFIWKDLTMTMVDENGQELGDEDEQSIE